MAQTDEKITKLEEALMEVFSFQSEEYCHRRYYEEIFLSGFMGKIYDKNNKYDSKFIKKLVRYFQTNQVILKDIESEIIEKTIKEVIRNPGEENEKTSDEIRYELEIEENSIGLFGYFIPLAEREIAIKNPVKKKPFHLNFKQKKILF